MSTIYAEGSPTSASAVPPPRRDDDLTREELAREAKSDYTTETVPLDKRKSQRHMTLLWIAGNAGFFSLYTGYAFIQGGLSLADIMLATLIGNVVVGLYWVGACALGAHYGQTETLLARSFFGRYGSFVVSLLLVAAGLGWFSFQANLTGVAVTSLLHISGGVKIASLICGLLMMTNNLFGFTSVSLWAKYVTAPIVTVWVLWAFAKAFATTPGHVLFGAPHIAQTVTIGLAAGAIIGNVSWGCEPDFWRWGTPGVKRTLIPIVGALMIGNVLFVLAGAVLAQIHSFTDQGRVFAQVSDYTIGVTAIGLIIFLVTQVAINDMNLYEAITGAQNILGRRVPRYVTTIVFGITGALFAYYGVLNYYLKIAELTGILVPCVTIVMLIDAIVLPRLFSLRRGVGRVPDWNELAAFNIPGILAVVSGLLVGAYTGALLFGNTNWGLAALNAWVTATVVYLAGVAIVRLLARSRTELEAILGYSRIAHVSIDAASA